jgi:hypothetical protein
MNDIIQDITKLTEEWRSLTGKDHCKDRDFHWYVETKWSYGQPPKYNVQHYGYIIGNIKEEYDSYDEALLKLKELLTREIKEYIKDRDENDEANGW